mgnify:CR=1 FL=1
MGVGWPLQKLSHTHGGAHGKWAVENSARKRVPMESPRGKALASGVFFHFLTLLCASIGLRRFFFFTFCRFCVLGLASAGFFFTF